MGIVRKIFAYNPFIKSIIKIFLAKGGYKFINRRIPEIKIRQSDSQACFVDVSCLVRKDLGTGIQRVIRNLFNSLENCLKDKVDVIPVWAEIGSVGYCIAEMGKEKNRIFFRKTYKPLSCKNGDIFLGVDHSVVITLLQLNFIKKIISLGVKVNFVCHDLLPVLHPEWFAAGVGRLEEEWLLNYVPITQMICVSKSVQAELIKWAHEKKINFCSTPEWVHNGYEKTEFENGAINPALVPSDDFCLVVGTIEPRKGHFQALEAFKRLWANGSKLRLVFVGQEGWKMASFCKELRIYREHSEFFYWYENCGDGDLDLLYKKCSFLLMPTKGEGFGLPILEAIAHSKKVICRDLPVFREITNNQAIFFAGDEPEAIISAIKSLNSQDFDNSEKIKIQSWENVALQVWECCKA